MDKFTQQLKFDLSVPSCVTEKTLKVSVIEFPRWDYKQQAYRKLMATWRDEPMSEEELLDTPKHVIKNAFLEILQFKTLPNSLEAIQFSFLVENLPLVEITHLLRHRTLSSIHAQCSGDRDLRDDSYYTPHAIDQSHFSDEYRRLLVQCRDLYARMVDSKEISIMDARYILPRAGCYFYYFSANLKDLMMIIKQRRCTMIQPELDNEFARQLWEHVSSHIPEMKEVMSIECDASCHYVSSPDDKNTRLYEPDEIHQRLLDAKGRHAPTSVYGRTRKQMGGKT